MMGRMGYSAGVATSFKYEQVRPILAIDPGCVLSAWVVWDGRTIHGCGKEPNQEVLDIAKGFPGPVYIEGMSFMGSLAGASLLDTAFWAGRFFQAAADVYEVKRSAFKLFWTGSRTSNDAQVRAAMIDRFGKPWTSEAYTPTGKDGRPLKPRTRRVPGLTAPLADDTWQCFALAAYVTERAVSQ